LLILGEIVYIFTGHEKIVELLNIYHSYFLHNLLDIRKILENLFTWKSVRNHGISLSHIKFFKRFRFIWVKVYIYDG